MPRIMSMCRPPHTRTTRAIGASERSHSITIFLSCLCGRPASTTSNSFRRVGDCPLRVIGATLGNLARVDHHGAVLLDLNLHGVKRPGCWTEDQHGRSLG